MNLDKIDEKGWEVDGDQPDQLIIVLFVKIFVVEHVGAFNPFSSFCLPLS
jgi:hypothetical protein